MKFSAEAFNSMVRGIVTLGLTFGLVYGFIVAKLIGAEAYIGVVGSVITFWFVQRGQERAAQQAPPPGEK